MAKSFHLYSDEEIKNSCKDFLNGEYSINNFFILASTEDHECGLILNKIYTFKNKYDALNYFYYRIKEWEDELTKSEYKKLVEKIENTLKNIKKNKTDIDISLSFLNFSTESLSFQILEEGYWDNAFHQIIKYIEFAFETEIEFLNGSNNNEDLSQEDKEEITLFNSKLNTCEILSNTDTINELLVSEFQMLCEFFNNYFDPI